MAHYMRGFARRVTASVRSRLTGARETTTVNDPVLAVHDWRGRPICFFENTYEGRANAERIIQALDLLDRVNHGKATVEEVEGSSNEAHD